MEFVGYLSGLQECKGNGFFEVGQAEVCRSGPENVDYFWGAAPARIYLPQLKSW